MKNILLLFVLSFIFECNVEAQIPNPVSFPDGVSVGATTTNGMFTPPLKTTTQINAITGMQIGMMVYDIDEKCLKIFNGSVWNCLTNSNTGNSAFLQNGPTRNFAKQISVGTSGTTANFTDMELANDSLYVVGNFIASITSLGPVTMDGFIYTPTVSGVIQNYYFISKYSPQANRIWTIPFPNNLYINDIKWHNSFLYVTGYFSNSITLTVNGTPTTYTSTNGTDTFVAKMDGNGNILWFTQTTQSTGNDWGVCLEITKNRTDLFVAGSFFNTITLGGGTPLTSAGGSDIFLTQLDTQTGTYKMNGGNFINMRGGGTGNDIPTNLKSVVVSNWSATPCANLICTGNYQNSITFGTSTVSSGINNTSTFIARFSNPFGFGNPAIISINGSSAGQTFSIEKNSVDNNFYFGENKTLTTLQVAVIYNIPTGSLSILGKTIAGTGTLLINYDIDFFSGSFTANKVSDFKNLKAGSLKNGILAGHIRTDNNLFLDNKLLADSRQSTVIMSLTAKGDLEWIRSGGLKTVIPNIAIPDAFASEIPIAVKNHSGKVWVCERYSGNHSFGDWANHFNGSIWIGSLWALY